MRRLRTAWIGLLALVVPALGLIQAGAAWALVAVFAALMVAESAILTFWPPDSARALAALLGGSILSHLVALGLALRAIRRAPPPLPWPRRWFMLPVWLALLVAATPDTWLGAGFDVYIVPSASMEPTLRVGERFFAHAVDDANPELRRGEVLVFRVGPGDGVDYVKRLVGLPGDRVQMRGGVLHLDGAPVQRDRLGAYTVEGGRQAVLYRETLPGGAAHEIVEFSDREYLDDTPEYRVPEGHLFFLGDSRDNSADSRIAGAVGFVPAGRVQARARFIIWGPDRGRIGTRLD